MTSAPSTYTKLASLTLLITLVLIVVGAATRVYDAGMSCPDWPHCYGVWWPWPEARVMAAGHPEGYMVAGQHYAWWQVALEWNHRLLAALVGFGLIGLIAFLFKQPKAHRARLGVPLAVSILLLATQIKLGAVTVWFSNIHWSVVLHLGNAMLFLAALAWLRRASAVLDITGTAPRTPLAAPFKLRAATLLFAAAVWATMLVGAFVSSSHSGGVCGGLPDCAGQWLPTDWQQHMHMQHRFFALATFVLSIVLLAFAKRLTPELRPSALKLHLMVLVQAALGILTLYSFSSYPWFYEILSLAHLTWGTFLFLAAVGVNLTLAYGTTGRMHGRA